MSDERCPKCDRPRATQEQFDAPACPSCGADWDDDACEVFCWREWNEHATCNEIDWRARALAAEALLREARNLLHDHQQCHDLGVDRQRLGSLVDRINSALKPGEVSEHVKDEIPRHECEIRLGDRVSIARGQYTNRGSVGVVTQLMGMQTRVTDDEGDETVVYTPDLEVLS